MFKTRDIAVEISGDDADEVASVSERLMKTVRPSASNRKSEMQQELAASRNRIDISAI